MVKTRTGLASLVAAGAIALSGCANYFGNTTPGTKIGDDAVEENCKTYSVEDVRIGDELKLYHLAFESKRGNDEIERGFYRKDYSNREIDPSCDGAPKMVSNEKRGNEKGMYFLVPAAEKDNEATVTLKNELDIPEQKPKRGIFGIGRKVQTSVLGIGGEVQQGYDLNRLFKDHRMHLPEDDKTYFVFPTTETVEQLDSENKGNDSPKYLPVFLVDTTTSLVINNRTGEAKFVDKRKKGDGKIKVLKFFSDKEAKKKLVGHSR